ncbi:hypothetical protein AB870_13495 [Pandoraea faecigallinarum]|uniref:Proteophosphoglycan ppg4 n=1 Tax=Pandoraea faecigallinarum TaxID=656179 RepID=A0A0H3WTE8_9BURK|nr:hypothetical protein [Pandoraea faecigallinarum]AKM30905.1 hypothetical protein AB870_13495 [Pandoraea faecigallinarum]
MKKLIISVAALTLAGASALSFAQGSAGGGAAGPGGGTTTDPSTPMPSQASPDSRQAPTPSAQTMTPADPHPGSKTQKPRHSTKKTPGNGNTGNGATNAPDNAPGKAQ